MTDLVFFDTDCISSFLWVDHENILIKLFPKRIILPKQVYDELSYPNVNRIKGLKSQVDKMIKHNDALINTIEVGTKTYNLYLKLTTQPDSYHKIIGKGEASAIALAKENQGILASNNLKDITFYVKEYKLKHLTTGYILKMAKDTGFITEPQGNIIWSNMLARKRKLGYQSFSDYLVANENIKVN